MIYQTDGDGDLDEAVFNTSDLEDEANAAVELSGSSITINLGSGWGRRPTANAGRSIRVTITRATAGKTKGDAEFRSSSSAKNGNLRVLDPHPKVAVGNILGIRMTGSDKDTFVDPLERKVEISPTKVYPGEKNKRITITFTAPGPMGSGGDPDPDADPAVTRADAYETLTIGIPEDLRPDDDFNDTTKGDLFNTIALHDGTSGIRVAARGGAVLGTDDDTSDDTRNPRVNNAGDALEIDIKSISEGQTIIVTYTTDIATLVIAEATADLAANADNPAAPDITDGSTTTFLASAKDTDTNFTASTGDTSVTTIKGGLLARPVGAGRLEVKPVSLEKGSKSRTFTVTYTAYSNVTGSIVINPAGIVIDDLDPDDKVLTELQNDSPSAYGYVRTTTTSNKGVLSVTSDTITWENAALVATDKVIIIIKKVNVVDEPDNYEWVTMVDDQQLVDDVTTGDVNEVGTLSVVKTSADTVEFAIKGTDSFPAASNETIEFMFTAAETPIRDGTVSFVIPSTLGSKPVAPKGLTDAQKKVLLGIVGASGGTLEKDQPTVSSRTVTVKIKVLEVGESVVISYGTGTKKALLHNVAADVKVIGNFRTSTGSRPAGTATVKLTNVKDGAAKEVTIGPLEVEAGSNLGKINIKFTAIGTMDDGYVSLDLPSTGWGLMQRDPSQRNYIEISGSNVTLESPAINETSSKAVAKITKLGAGQSFTFVYGGGTAGTSNGAQVQDDLGIATFIVESDGDGDGIFAAISSEKKQTAVQKQTNPDQLGAIFEKIGKQSGAGELRVEVKAAADGTGTVEVDPKMVRAAANDVKLTFTYTSTQTIRDGELRFNVPSGWSKPQVSEAGEEGYTVVSGNGLGTAEAPEAASKRYITVPIVSITKGDEITIAYGDADDGKAKAPTAAGESVFGFAVQGTEDGALQSLSAGSPTVTVERQASGKAKSATAMVSDNQGMLYAGQDDRQITVIYTTAGEIVAGQVRLTIPAKAVTIEGLGWSAPTADNVTVSPTSAYSTVEYGGFLSHTDSDSHR